MRGRKPKHDSRVVRYLNKNGPSNQVGIAKALKIPVVSLYSTIKRLVEQGAVKMEGKLVTAIPTAEPKKPLLDMKLVAETARKLQTENAVDRIAILKNEIDNITDGIRSLMITRSYLMRRVQEEQKDV
jgi:DNA-binding Lrp family transcriptional regulator